MGIDDFHSLLDDSGARERQHRHTGSRKNYPEIAELPMFNCGCEEPCFAEMGKPYLNQLWCDFAILAKSQAPQQAETGFLLNTLYNKCSNSVVLTCSTALAMLFCVSEKTIAEVKRCLQRLCSDPDILGRPLRERLTPRYVIGHPANRLPEDVIRKIESEMEFACRADPAATDGSIAVRPNDPEITTRERLRHALVQRSFISDEDSRLPSASTVDRIVNQYLEERGMRITFAQSDHNACPVCKSHKLELLAIDLEIKTCSRASERPVLQDLERLRIHSDLERLCREEDILLAELTSHTKRDASLRKWLKQVVDKLRAAHNKFIADHRGVPAEGIPHAWCSRFGMGMITHQDDMSKVDLPSTIVDASCDITRFRFNVNAHVNLTTKDSVVFSHEQGSGPRNGSSVMETILLQHLLQCKGEEIKIVVSDCASVGRNWCMSVAFPQYIVDQGLASIVLVVFLENNHGKFHADLLFGHFQRRSNQTIIVGIDDLLSTFEGIRGRHGRSVSGFALNPLSSVDYVQVLTSLGYATKVDPSFSFII